MKRTLFAVFILIFLGAPALAQDPSSWRGLQLGSSTPEDAIAALGDPKKRKQRQKLHTAIKDFIDKKKRYEVFEYKEPRGMKKAWLYFDQGTLVAIELEPQAKINPNTLPEAYGVDLYPKIGRLDALTSRPGRDAEGKMYPKKYPSSYQLVGKAENSFVVVMVNNHSFGRALLGGDDDGHSFPGKVWRIQLISKSLEDKAGLDALQ